jgi:TolB-like protein
VGVPTLAVIPLRSANLDPQAAALGEWVAQAVMEALLPCPDVRLISRMSTRLFQNRDWTSLQLQEVLHADYVLSGSVQWRGATIEMTWMFRATRSEQVIWQQRITGKGSDVRRAAVRWREALVARVLQSLQQDAWQQGQARPLPALNSSLLLMVAVQAMHGSSGASFGQARAQLEALIERHPRLAALLAGAVACALGHARRGRGFTRLGAASLAPGQARTGLGASQRSGLGHARLCAMPFAGRP